MKYRFFLFIWLVFMTLAARPQKPEFRILVEGIGDNREFSGGKSLSQTILGTRGAFEAGTTIDGHRLRAGLSRLFEFGSPPDYHMAELILYYQFEDKVKTFHFGSFPRRELVNFPLGMLTDTLNYYRPNIEGLRGEYRWNSGHQNIFIDWTGRQTSEVREAFTAAASGELSFNGFFFQNYLLLNHLAHSKPRGAGEHINDNLGFSLLAGWRSDESLKYSGYLKAGILGSAFRERSVTDGIIHAQSLLAEAYYKNGNFAVKATFHSGDGHNFMAGDSFYRSENYLRTDLIWHFINHKNIKGRFNLSFHLTEWSHFDHSQQISIIYALPNL